MVSYMLINIFLYSLQVTQLVKHDNRLWFREEITSVLHHIKETQNTYLYWKKVN